MTAGFWIDMIDVGEGDAFLLTLGADSRDATVLIDAGPPGAGSKVADFVEKYAGNHLDMVICTHLDMDHIGGMGEVVKRCSIEKIYMNVPASVLQDNLTYFLRRRIYQRSYSGTDSTYLERSLQTASDLVDALQQDGLTPQPILTGASWSHGNDVTLNVVNPTQEQLDVVWEDIDEGEAREAYLVLEQVTRTEAPDTTAENNASVVLELVYKGQPYGLFTADAGVAVLKVVSQGQQYPFLKVPHHGSKTGLDETLVEQLSSNWAFIPVGPNPHGHPASEILDMLKDSGAKTYCSGGSKHCRQGCPKDGFGTLCHTHDRDVRPEWSATKTKCNNHS